MKVQELTESIDPDSGEPVETWSTLVACLPAARADLTGTERFTAEQMAAKFDSEWEVNYRTDMDPDLIDVPKKRRLIEFNRVYDVVSCDVIGRRAGLVIKTLASSKVPT